MNLRFAVLTVSDRSSQGERKDRSGPELVKVITAQGWQVTNTEIVPDEVERITEIFLEWCGAGDVDVILSTGGTGFAPRDITPEATKQVVERSAPGLAEAMRSASLEITPHAMLSRGAAGIRDKTLIINLPGSPKAARENLEVVLPVLPHAVDLLREDPEAERGHRRVNQG